MSFNTYPYSPFPASTEQLHKGDNEDLQAQIDAIKDGTSIDSFGDVETALASKTDNDVIAPEFDADAGVYAVGDLVIYEGKLYEFTTAHETAGAWNSEEVSEKTVADEVDSLKSGLTNVGRIPTTSPESAITSIAGGANYTYTATSDGFLAVHAPLAQDAREFNVFMKDIDANKYGVAIYAKVVMYYGNCLGGMFVKAGRSYYIDNVGSNSVDLYLDT